MKRLCICLALGAGLAGAFWFFFAHDLSYEVYSYTGSGDFPKEPWYTEEFSPAGKVLLTVFVGIGCTVGLFLGSLPFSKKR